MTVHDAICDECNYSFGSYASVADGASGFRAHVAKHHPLFADALKDAVEPAREIVRYSLNVLIDQAE